MYDSLPKRERKISVDIIGEITGHHYTGDFTVKCSLSILEKQLLGIEKTRLISDYSNPTPDLMGIANTLSNLRVKIVKGPEWWTESQAGALIEDENILVHIMDKITLAEKDWREDLKKRAEEAKKESSGN